MLALSGTTQGKYAEAEPLYEKCQVIQEKALGPEHPELAATLNNRAGVLEAQVRADRGFSYSCRRIRELVCWFMSPVDSLRQRSLREWVQRNQIVLRLWR